MEGSRTNRSGDKRGGRKTEERGGYAESRRTYRNVRNYYYRIDDGGIRMKEGKNMYGFFLNMWIMRKIDETFLSAQVRVGRITEQEKTMIMATPQL